MQKIENHLIRIELNNRNRDNRGFEIRIEANNTEELWQRITLGQQCHRNISSNYSMSSCRLLWRLSMRPHITYNALALHVMHVMKASKKLGWHSQISTILPYHFTSKPSFLFVWSLSHIHVDGMLMMFSWVAVTGIHFYQGDLTSCSTCCSSCCSY